MSTPIAAQAEALVAMLLAELERGLEARIDARVREALKRGAATDAEWLAQTAAAKVAGVTPQTVRDWQRAGLIAKGRRGRVSAAELRTFLAERDGKDTDTRTVPDLSAERAKRLAQSIRGGA